MGQLLESAGLPEPRTLRRGEVLDGSVINVDREGVLVDIGSKSEGIVPTNEMHSMGADPLSKINVGDDVLVYVLQPETEEGQVLLSIDRARGEQGWRELQVRFESGEAFEAEVTGFNKGGLLANIEGVNAFIPMSQVVGAKPGTEGTSPLSEQVGRQLRLKVIEINRRRNRVILSERAALQEWRAEQKDRLLDELAEGEIREGSVTSIRNFGVFVDLGGADGLVHLSELSWDRNVAPEDLLTPGDTVKVYVMKVDQENKKIALSIRRASPEQWQELITQYAVGDVVPAVVTKLVAFGAFARLPGPVEGLVHVSELVEQRIGHPQEIVDEGDVLPLKIVRIEHDRHRLGLSLREARREAEIRGWGFDSTGRVIQIAEDVGESFAEEVEAAQARMEARRAQVATRPSDGGGGSDGTPDRPERDEPPPLTAMAAAMQEAQAQLNADSASAEESPAEESPAEEAPAVEAETPVAEAPAAPEADAPVAEAPAAPEADAPVEDAPAVAEAEASVDAPPEAAAEAVPEAAPEAVADDAPAGDDAAVPDAAAAEGDDEASAP
ncbi:MAG: S1 RNA-binding domain-containing protein [Dehalococcoidia bacterium]|jgi:small subunit ribosomal protein S1|nr:S1 RNA-binding domain-containing protein [Dehalococcoidia bacterium]